jgi:hypothetical protein
VENQYGVTSALCAANQGGSFSWYGGGGNYAGEADFYIGAPDDTIVISGGNFESSNRFVEQPAAVWNSAGFPVILEGNRWSGDALNADGFAIKYWSGGPLTLIGNIIGQTPSKDLKIWQAGGPSYGLSLGNYYASTDASVLQGMAGQPWYWTSQMDVQNNNGTMKPIANSYGIGSYTVSGLSALSPALGQQVIITDQTSACPAKGGTFTGGGNVKCQGWFNGASWIAP